MKSILAVTAMMAAMGGMSGMGMPSLSLGRRDPDPVMPPIRHTGPISKGCHLDVVRMEFQNSSNKLFVDVDIVWGTRKAREKKINMYRRAIAHYVHYRYIGDIEKTGLFIIEPLITPGI